MIPAAAHEPARAALRLFVLLAAFTTLLVVAAPAGAAPSCGRAVIDDWYEDGRVDGTYALHCYDDAIETLPRDVRDYSNAKEEIQRALQAAKRGEDAPPTRTDPTPGASTSPEDPDEPTETTESTATPPTSGPTDGDGESETVAGGLNAESDSASSVPIPLLILAGLALLLILAGTAGYVIRRLQARRLPPPRSN